MEKKKIIWSKESLVDLERIFDFIGQDSKYYATLFCEEVIERVEFLSKHPKMGRKVPEGNSIYLREIIFKGYRIIYRIKKENIEVATIIHGSKLLKS